MDSYAIATEIDRRHPSPPLRLDSPGVARTQAAVDRVVEALAPVAIPRVPGMILNPVSREFCDDARFRRRFGVTLRELEEGEKGGEAAWGNAREGLEEVRGLLGEHAGPFVLGEEPSYADFILAGVWGFCERLDQGGDLYGRLMEMDEKFREHHEACRPWMKRDD
jgi:glutathione S-transferase